MMTDDQEDRGTSASRSTGRRAPRSRQLQRLMDQGPRVSGRTWLHLVILVGVLVLLFATRDEFGRKAAGCYGRVAGEDGLKSLDPVPPTESPALETGRGELVPTPTVKVAPP